MRDLEAQLQAYGLVLDRADAAVTEVVDVGARPTRRSLLVAIAAVAVVAIAVATFAVSTNGSGNAHRPNVVTPGSSQPAPPTSAPTPVRAPGVLAIGDSVMLGSKVALEAAIPGIAVDAAVSRQFGEAADVLTVYANAGVLPGTIVVALGTNALPTDSELEAIMRVAGQREVYFVTVRVPRTWESATNAAIRALPDRWPNAHVIEWHDYATSHDDWFVADGFHLTDAGQTAYSALIAESIGRPPADTATTVPATSALDVVNVIDEPALPPAPLAAAGGKVWIATESRAGPGPLVHLEGRDPSTTKVLDTIDVPQEAVFSIAGEGDTLWVAGGGDGGVPQTTVSKVDVRTKSVVFTKTLTGTSCSCPIVAGTAGVWLVGNGSTEALHLSPLDGHVIGRVHFANAGATAAMEVRARLVVGLDDGSIAIVAPSRDRIERTIPLPTIGDPPVEQVSAMSAVNIAAVGTDPAIDGVVMRRGGSESALFVTGWQLGDVLSTDFFPATVTSVQPFVWVFGGDRLQVNSTHAIVWNDFAYHAEQHRFERVPASAESHAFGFRDAIAVDNMVWVVYDAADGTGTPSIVAIDAAPQAVAIR